MRTSLAVVLAAAAVASAQALLVPSSAAYADLPMASLRKDWKRVGRTPGAANVKFHVALPMSNKDKLNEAFDAVSYPSSPKYGQYATMAELNALLAAPEALQQRVAGALEEHGAVCELLASGTAFRCNMAAKDVEAMLQTRMHRLEHREHAGVQIDRIDYHGQVAEGVALESVLTFPEALQHDVRFFTGLVGLPVPHYGQTRAPVEGLRVVEDGSSANDDDAGHGPHDTKLVTIPSTIRALYGITGQGSASVVQAPIEFQGLPAYGGSDLADFATNTSVPTADVAKIIGGFNPLEPQGESCLDIEYITGVGQGTTTWYWTTDDWMYEWGQAFQAAEPSNVPDISSMSYGWAEDQQCTIAPFTKPCGAGGSQAYVEDTNTIFQAIGTAGYTLVAASGDSGAHGRSDGFCLSAAVTPGFPASSPYVFAVGATQLAHGEAKGTKAPLCKSDGGFVPCATGGTEIVCSTATGAIITSGGGFSGYADTPSYQADVVAAYLAKTGVTPPSTDFNSKGRGYPDVAALGHNYYIAIGGQAAFGDGTSASCPVWAAVLGLVQQAKGSKIGAAGPLVYAAHKANAAAFTDVTVGDNYCTEQLCCSTGFNATAGWDATTGLGSPVVPELVKGVQQVLGLAQGSVDHVLSQADLLQAVATNNLRGGSHQ